MDTPQEDPLIVVTGDDKEEQKPLPGEKPMPVLYHAADPATTAVPSLLASDEPVIPPPKPPTLGEIQDYLRAKNPLGFGEGEVRVSDIDPQEFSPHFNFLVESARGKAVLRTKGPEFEGASPLDGIENEYNILKYVERYEVAPEAFFFDPSGVGGVATLFVEFVEGTPFNALSENEQREILPAIGLFTAQINAIPVDERVLPFDYPLNSYDAHRDKWWKRLVSAENDPRLAEWSAKASQLVPQAEAMLVRFEPMLQAVIERGDSAFVFVAARAANLMITRKGLRFLNWEAVRQGDPSFTLGVFLSSVADSPLFEEAKQLAVTEYQKERPVDDFTKLLDQRLAERAVSNFTWLLWKQTKKKHDEPLDEEQLARWFERAMRAVQ